MADRDGQPRRKRARLACTACNARRVKCNVVESRPCRNCVAANAPCETRESRRGKHPRKPRVTEETPEFRSRLDSIVSLEDGPVSSLHVTTLRNHEELAASQALASLSGSHQEIGQQPIPQRLPGTVAGQTDAVSEVRQEPSEAVLKPDRHEDDVFLGESTSLRYVTDESAPTIRAYKRPRLRHSVPSGARADSLIPQWESERRRTRMKNLHEDGAFTFPPAPIREKLLGAYFRWFHPHFPVVDEPEIWSVHKSGSMSPLLLQAMLFIGVIHCEESTLEELGWGNRHRAKYQLYSRAKDIYDAEYETKKLIVIQALFLMSFWRAGALLEKDVRHWIGAVISLAQTKAFHRSGSENENHSTRLRRRIWWAIYVRERQCSSALGLPNRIRDDDCDVEMLSEADFELAFDPSTTSTSVTRYKAYTIGMTQLAILLGKVVDAGYLPNRTLSTDDRSRIRGDLEQWKQQLGSSIKLSSDADSSFQASMLHLAYNNLHILLHRSAFIAEESDAEAANFALHAAARNSRIVEDMLSEGTMGHAQIHVITNLFNTLCIHVAHLRRSNGITQTIAEHRAKLCLLGLQELQRTWEVTNWVLQLFFQYLDRTTAARLAMEADDVGIMSAASNTQHLNVDVVSAAPSRGESHALELSGAAPANSLAPGGDLDNAVTPWSWTTDEANQYLFSQIESDFAFGEGGMLDWSPEAVSHFAGFDQFA
ncbi:uncharacterized protein CC84DRAFT_1126408 [Paraphaeosphaeria sporulosa]|uniref:Zn(2)-C6 fungal-type domain-containing protein n=1 Tax=Paraphaeosphaeria sporulosa TaxID=1460663 RepID=A0A177C4Z4_9PLEO|nr:uncharacterized protein CC84DRAFT_1126408 [Paraphaeosphaeria sporulosa]OAG02231.1 hypothetical protein CC84DRAFT_1126408 [Paraphaeosphaeria sporulosa]